MKVYIAGPMTGYVDHNFPAFNAAAARLRALGYDAVNPAEMDEGLSAEELAEIPHEVFMRRDIACLVGCDGIYTLPGWRYSKGASLEVKVAQGCGLLRVKDPNVEVWRSFEGEPIEESVEFNWPHDEKPIQYPAVDEEEISVDECPTFHTFTGSCRLAREFKEEFKASYAKVLPEGREIPLSGPIVHHVTSGPRANHQFFGVEFPTEEVEDTHPENPEEGVVDTPGRCTELTCPQHGERNRREAEAEGLEILAAQRTGLRIVETEEQAADELAARRTLAAADSLQAEGPDEFPRGYYVHLAEQAEAERRANEDAALGGYVAEYRRLQQAAEGVPWECPRCGKQAMALRGATVRCTCGSRSPVMYVPGDPDSPQPGDEFPNVAYVRHMTGKTAAELAQDSEQFEMGVE